ncbi:DUF1801 domain-containing protein [Brumimicrobium glaciale]|uniref:DUF1801 domain-containing protein n=1 Tax=Brumimicrobium glaciale TaxID=200475 RepID=A0A4Q4KDW3_9FLAO|nr:DUF1801 domain-containing protein [Brumimicrobium glaciale]RYM30828.1 DUF1801 domain-containing protein [Brumimicrobium glaciale]
MAKNKTQETEQSVEAFIGSFANTEQKKKDSFELIKLMKEMTGCEPKMWGPTIIGFGSYHYKYASGHEGDAPLLGFSPRKSEISLYVYSGEENDEHLLENLGKFRKGKSCIYIKKMEDIDQEELNKVMKKTLIFLDKTYGAN